MNGEQNRFRRYYATNLTFDEVYSGEYALPLNNEPATVLDIGANEGAFTAWALERWPNCKVIAFEPIPENADYFRKNTQGIGRVTFNQLAVAEDAEVVMRYGKNCSSEASRYDLGAQNGKTVTVKTVSPRLLPSAEFVKIDTEGCEVEIISGLDLSGTKGLVCEYHRPEDEPVIREICAQKGLEFFSHTQYSKVTGLLKFARAGAVKTPRKEPINLFIAIPSFFNIDPHFHQCLIQAVAWLAKIGIGDGTIHGNICHAIGDGPHVGRARNLLTRKFLEEKPGGKPYTDILFIDSDIVFSVDNLKRILSHDEDIIGGLYFKKQEGEPSPVINAKSPAIVRSDGLVEVRYMGTGFMRIRRNVFERMIEAFGDEMAYTPDSFEDVMEYNFWPLATYTWGKEVCKIDPLQVKYFMEKYKVSEERANKAIRTRWLSEDWWFCQKAIELGYKIWADQAIALRHSGNVLYPLKTQEEKIFDRRKVAAAPMSESDSPLVAASA